MFSTSMIASSTTTPTAITNPARIIVLRVAPRASSTSPPATRDSGMATRLIRAVRHSNRKAASTIITSTHPRTRARVRLSKASWMKSAGRKIDESISRPGRPGRSSASAASTSRVACSVLAHGYLNTTSMSPGPSLMTASPNSGQVSSTTSATSLKTSGVPSTFRLSEMGTWARSWGLTSGETDRMPSR